MIVSAQNTNAQAPVSVYFFWAHGCKSCEKAQILLNKCAQKYPGINIIQYEVYLNGENRKIYKSFLDAAQHPPQGLPTIIIGDNIWTGFQPDYESEIQTTIEACLLQGCPDLGANLNSVQTGNKILHDTVAPAAKLTVPLLGSVQLSQHSLIINTLLIGFVDGFNPCSLWVLGVLLSLATYTKSRLKTFTIGGFFITISGLIYGLFITGIFSLISILGFLKIIRVTATLVALLFGFVNIKDYFAFKQGVSFTIADSEKSGIYQKMRALISGKKSLLSLLVGIAVLAASVSLIELSCTSGFPVIWSNLLASQHTTSITYLSLLILYLFIYMIDEIVIFISVVISLRSVKLKQEQGKFLKLVSGITIAALGVTMLIQPEWMNNLISASLVFLISIFLSLVIHSTTHFIRTRNLQV